MKEINFKYITIINLIALLSFTTNQEVAAAIFNDGTIFQLISLGIIVFAFGYLVVKLLISVFTTPFVLPHAAGLNLLIMVAIFMASTLISQAQVIDLWRGKPILTAKYRGTVSQARLTLRQSGAFDLYESHILGSSFYSGTFSRSTNQVVLRFKPETDSYHSQTAMMRIEGNSRYLRINEGLKDRGQSALDFKVIETGTP